MNVSEYIASGILESYALGAVSEQEHREVDCLCAIYPDVKEELDRLTKSLEAYALLHSEEPPAELKQQLLAQLDFTTERLTFGTESDMAIRPLNSLAGSGLTYKFSWLVAASVGLVMLIFSGYLFTQLSQSRQTADALNANNIELNDAVHQFRNQQERDQQVIALLTTPGTRTIRVVGNDKAPTGNLVVYWNKTINKVAVSVSSLPELPTDKQYQLWALVNGKPVDAGIFERDPGVQPLRRVVALADAFAVTIEQRGGSPTPTLSTLLAVGNVG